MRGVRRMQRRATARACVRVAVRWSCSLVGGWFWFLFSGSASCDGMRNGDRGTPAARRRLPGHPPDSWTPPLRNGAGSQAAPINTQSAARSPAAADRPGARFRATTLNSLWICGFFRRALYLLWLLSKSIHNRHRLTVHLHQSRNRRARPWSAEMAAATVRRSPYKDFLQPALQRRFATASLCVLAIAYLQALLLANWSSSTSL